MEKRIIDIPLYGGVDTKTTEKLVPVSRSLILENAVMQNTGEIKKRFGYDKVTVNTIGDTSGFSNETDDTIYDANSIHSYNRNLIMVGSNGGVAGETDHIGPHMFSTGEASAVWNHSGNYIPCTFEVDGLTSSDKDTTQSNRSSGNNTVLIAYEQTPNVYFDVFGTDDIHYVDKKTLTDVVAPITGYISDGYGDFLVGAAIASTDQNALGSGIYGLYFDTSDNTDRGSSKYIDVATTNIHTDLVWDATTMSIDAHEDLDGYGEFVACWKRQSDHQILLATFDSQLNTHRSKILDIVPKNAVSINYIINPSTGEDRLYLIYQDDATGNIDGYAFSQDLTEVLSKQTISTAFTSETVTNITMAVDPALADDNLRIFIGADGTRPSLNYIKTTSTDWDLAVVSTVDTEMWHESLVSRAFTYGSRAYVTTLHNSSLQSTYFLRTAMDLNNTLTVAKIFYGGAGTKRSQTLVNVTNNYPGSFTVCCEHQTRLLSDNNRDYQVSTIKYNLEPKALQSVTMGDTLVVGGGIITGFDGRSQELGFHLHPEYLELTGPGVGGAMDDGNRSYVCVYSWIDRNGNIYRSSPSPAVNYNYVGGTSTQSDKVVYEYLSETDPLNKGDSGVGAQVEFYRTEGGGSIYYLVTAATVNNDTKNNNNTATLIGSESDIQISNNEQLYTTGGALVNIAPPASNILAASKNRIFLVPMDDPEAMWYSKEKVKGIGIEFSEELQIRVEQDGNNTGLASLDDKIIIFKERSMYFISGEGPNDLNQGGFSPVRKISSEVGCVDSASIINIGQGVMFKSQKGIYMVSRSLQVSYIGAPVEKWNQYEVVTSDLLEDKNQVRFVLERGRGALVYDYYHKQWSIYTNHPAKDSTVHNGVYYWLNDDGVLREETTAFKDSSFKIPLKIRTGWIKVGGVQGYQRVRTATIMGEYKSPHDLVVNVYYDYDEVTIGQTITFASSGSIVGNEVLQYKIHLAQQKCNAIMFEIYDDNQKITLESLSLNSVALEVGVKRGTNKLPPRKRD